MLHLGDITKISGYTAPITDCVVGGSPCQDLSIAGKRAGLDGERSGLFMEQIRIIKEMRDRDVRENGRTDIDVRPRYMVWENVPGAFSSNKGEDFRIVLEETARVKDKDAHVPMPDNGKWQTSGCLLGNGWSIAWRVLDAQFWGVPQRRRRIALVADFGGHSAPEILFVRKSVSGHTQSSQSQGKATAQDATRGIGADDIYCIDGDKLNKKERNGGSGIGYREGSQYTLTAKDVHGVAYSFEPGIASREGGHIYENVSGTLRANAGDNQMSAAYTMKIRSGCDVDANGKAAGKGALIQTEKSGTLSCVQDQYLFQPVGCDVYNLAVTDDKVCSLTAQGYTSTGTCPKVIEPVVTVFSKSRRASSSTDYETWKDSGTANTLNTFDNSDVRTNECVIALDRASYNQGQNAQFDIGIDEKGIAQSMVAKGPGAVCYSCDEKMGNTYVWEDQANTFAARDYKQPQSVCYSLDPLSSNSMKSSNPNSGCHETDVARTIDTTNPDPSKNQGGVAVVETYQNVTGPLMANSHPGSYTGQDAFNDMLVAGQVAAVDCRNGVEADVNATLQMGAFRSLNCNNVVRTRYTVRRLTPLECERLQGYPSGWTDIGEYIDSNGKKKQSSDAARYKALGNSIALPPWKWVMKRLCACYERDATLASLFDGIGGFPYIWEQINGKGSCLWASEIEDFPIAVTKVRVGE